MSKESSLLKLFDGDRLIGLALDNQSGACQLPTQFELESVRIFNEYKELMAENERLRAEIGMLKMGFKPEKAGHEMSEKIVWVSRDKYGMYYVWSVCPKWIELAGYYEPDNESVELLGEIDWLKPTLKPGECKQYKITLVEQKAGHDATDGEQKDN